MKASVCIATYNKPRHLDLTLKSIAVQRPPFDFEVIVVDDGSPTDETRLVCGQYDVRYIRLNREPRWKSPCISKNVSFRAARGEVLIVQDDDIVHVSPDTIERMVRELGRKEWISAWVRNDTFAGVPHGSPAFYRAPHRIRALTLAAVWRKHIYAVGGHDEQFKDGHGHEDLFLADCLIAGLGLDVRFPDGLIGSHRHHDRRDHTGTRENSANGDVRARLRGNRQWVASGGAWQMPTEVDSVASYVAASGFPSKLLLHPSARRMLPEHVQWYATNRCNLACPFCSFHGVDRSLEMDLDESLNVIDSLAERGCRAVSLTGGGEPLCHSGLGEMIDRFRSHGIQVALVTNGLLLDRLDTKRLRSLAWCRISHSDDREFSQEHQDRIRRRVEEVPTVDWGINYILTRRPNYDMLRQIIRFAAENGFAYTRIAADLWDDAVDLDAARREIGDVPGVFFAGRSASCERDGCLVGYIRPVIAPDFSMYLCCAVQHAIKGKEGTMPEELRMGDARHLGDVYDRVRTPFSVSCDVCYYRPYNNALKQVARGIDHEPFI